MISKDVTCFRCKEKRTITYSEQDMQLTKHGRAYVKTVCPQEGCGRSITTLVSKKNLTKSESENDKPEESDHDSGSSGH